MYHMPAIPQAGPSLHPTPLLQLPTTVSPPHTPHIDYPSDQVRLYQALSPLPDVRRESHTEFEFPPTIPVPSEFADMSGKSTAQEGPIPIEDIPVEVRIQSSTENLLDVSEDEPYTFEEKSITEIRDSLANSLNNSIDIDEDWEQTDTEEKEEEQEKHDEGEVEAVKEDSQASEGEEDKERTETLDSDETDETVKETHKYEGKEGDDTSPEGEPSVIDDVANIKDQDDLEEQEDADRDVFEAESEEVSEREEPTGAELDVEVDAPEVPLTQEEEPSEGTDVDTQEDSIPPQSERIVEGAEAVTEDEMDDEEKGEDCE